MKIQQLLQSIRQTARQQPLRVFSAWHSRKADLQALEQVDAQFAPLAGDQRLHIVYVMNHVRVCGGSKIILEHCNQLIKRGHAVTIVCYEARPDWIEVLGEFIQVPPHATIGQTIPTCDVIVCTVADQLWDAYLNQKAPVLHFEQGDSYIYEFDKLNAQLQAAYRPLWSVPVPTLSVSSGLSRALAEHFGRGSQVLHNALNSSVFYPRKAARTEHADKRLRILFVGAEQVPFKGVADIRAALQIVQNSGRDFEAVWVTPHEPSAATIASFDGELHVSPSQQVLGDVYRSCDLYVSGSYYESFPLPPLEAMTSGCAVISTQNVGIVEYGRPEENCLLFPIGDVVAMAEKIIELLDDSEKRARLVAAGYATARQFTWPVVMERLENFLYGQVQAWQAKATASTRLRIETLPRGLSQTGAREQIRLTHLALEEEWCLYLVEGEQLSVSEQERLVRMLDLLQEDRYSVQVCYEADVSEHPLVRHETRLLRRGAVVNVSTRAVPRLQLRISDGTEGYFLSDWQYQARTLYLQGRYPEMIPLLQNEFAQAPLTERSAIIKWLVLALIELDRTQPSIALLRDAIEAHPGSSDLYYLYSRLVIALGDPTVMRSLLAVAAVLQDAQTDLEFFADMAPMCRMYLEQLPALT